MSLWEKQFREKLEKELPNNAYQVGKTIWTGKLGFIDYEVLIRKELYNQIGIELTLDKSLEMVEKEVEEHFKIKNNEKNNNT